MGPRTLELRQTILPLRLIFWGCLLCLVDYYYSHTVNDVGWRFDFANDLAGMLMITWAVFRLATFVLSDGYRFVIRFVCVVAVARCFVAFHDHFVYEVPPLFEILEGIIGIATLPALVLFCLAMQWICRHHGHARPAQSWRTTFWLFMIIYVLPLGLLDAVGVFGVITGQLFSYDLGVGGLILIPIGAIPIVHLFISTSRMKAAIDSGPPAGFPVVPLATETSPGDEEQAK